jgi:hypothetical protein
MGHFGFFRRTHLTSIHPFDEAEDSLFTGTFALECRPMDLPGRQRVGLRGSTRGLRYTPCRPRSNRVSHGAYCLRKALGDGDLPQLR